MLIIFQKSPEILVKLLSFKNILISFDVDNIFVGYLTFKKD